MSWPEQIFKWLGYGKYTTATPSGVADGAVIPILVDTYGRVQVSSSAAAPLGVTVVRQKTASNQGSLKSAGAGSLVEVTLWNNGAVALWFQIHDSNIELSGGETCVDQIMIPAGASMGWRPAVPVACTTQLRWAASTDPAIFTEPGTAAIGFSAGVL